jgi:hypothetical protein
LFSQIKLDLAAPGTCGRVENQSKAIGLFSYRPIFGSRTQKDFPESISKHNFEYFYLSLLKNLANYMPPVIRQFDLHPSNFFRDSNRMAMPSGWNLLLRIARA